jgi:chemotaxis protein histidine kinase CheA
MLNGNEWQHSLPDFLIESQALIAKSEECLCHLELFINDKDAIECLLSTLLTLTREADVLSLESIADFSQHIRHLLDLTPSHASLQGDALSTLRDCFALLAWQLELIDTDTGILLLDDSEQLELLSTFATIVGLEDQLVRFTSPKRWSTALALKSEVAPESIATSRIA